MLNYYFFKKKSSLFKNLYDSLTELGHCEWLIDIQKSNVSYILNIMQEKSLMLGLGFDLPPITNTVQSSQDIRKIKVSKSNFIRFRP